MPGRERVRSLPGTLPRPGGGWRRWWWPPCWCSGRMSSSEAPLQSPAVRKDELFLHEDGSLRRAGPNRNFVCLAC